LYLLLYILFFFPAIFAFMVAGWHFFELSWMQNERSMFSPSGPIIWPFKGIIPIVGFIMLLQGLVEVVRCVRCVRYLGCLRCFRCRRSRRRLGRTLGFGSGLRGDDLGGAVLKGAEFTVDRHGQHNREDHPQDRDCQVQDQQQDA
jgi:hypothetical protein